MCARSRQGRGKIWDGSYAGAVIGGGATTRSAIVALWTLGLNPIYLINRDPREVGETIKWFATSPLNEQGLRIRPLNSAGDVEEALGETESPVVMAVGAIPGS